MARGTMSDGIGGRPAAVAVALRHRPGIALLALVCGLLWPLSGQAQFLVSPLAQPAHDLREPGRVDTILKLADGRYLVGGLFTRVGNLSANGAARLQSDGSPDASFVSALGNVTDFAVDSQGRVYACNGNRLVRLTAQGDIDSSFPAVTPNVNTQITRVEIDADQIYVSGTFTSINGVNRLRIAKLSLTGVVDPAWSADASFTVLQLLAPGDGFVYIAGDAGTLGGSARTGIGRVSTISGAVDAWNPVLGGEFGGATRSVSAIAFDGTELFIAGRFSSVNGTTRSGLAKISRASNATVSSAITTSLSGFVGLATVFGPHLYLGASQSSLSLGLGASNISGRLLRIDRSTGALDTSFEPLADTEASEIGPEVSSLVPADGGGRMLIGGDFARMSAGQIRLSMAALNPNGSVDSLSAVGDATRAGLIREVSFDQGAAYIRGSFERVNGAPRRNLIRLAADGTVDGNFRPPNVEINAAVVVPGDAVYVADRSNLQLIRLNRFTGDVLPGFAIPYTQVINRLEVAGPHLYLYGSFQISTVSPNLSGYGRVTLATGAVDGSYRPALVGGSASRTLFDASTNSLFLIGGFSSIDGQARTGLARLNASNLAVDSSWNPVLSTSSTLSAALDGAGGLYIGGNFQTVNGANCRGPARLLLAGTGSLDAAFPCDRATVQAQNVAFASGRVYGHALNQPIRRFLPAGALIDQDWSATVDRGLSSLALDAARVFVFGDFNQTSGQPRAGLAALPQVERHFANGFE